MAIRSLRRLASHHHPFRVMRRRSLDASLPRRGPSSVRRQYDAARCCGPQARPRPERRPVRAPELSRALGAFRPDARVRVRQPADSPSGDGTQRPQPNRGRTRGARPCETRRGTSSRTATQTRIVRPPTADGPGPSAGLAKATLRALSGAATLQIRAACSEGQFRRFSELSPAFAGFRGYRRITIRSTT
jgi:hypothetical protein